MDVFIGATLTGFFTIVGLWIGRRQEHRRWLRDARLRACEEFLAEADRIMIGAVTTALRLAGESKTTGVPLNQVVVPVEVVDQVSVEMASLVERKAGITLLGPPAATDAADRLCSVVQDPIRRLGEEDDGEIKKRREAFIAAAHGALTERWRWRRPS